MVLIDTEISWQNEEITKPPQTNSNWADDKVCVHFLRFHLISCFARVS